MTSAKRWLIYQLLVRAGRSKPDKVPYYSDGTPRGKTDTPADADRLTTYDEAKRVAAARGDGWGMGFALGTDRATGTWQGIDLDDISQHQLSDLVDALPGYVERSPSGKGVHAVGYGRHFRAMGSNSSGIEAYAGGRFFTVTGEMIRDAGKTCMADFVETVLAPRHNSDSGGRRVAATDASAVVVSVATIADLRAALDYLPSDNRGLWIRIGHALKELGDVGCRLWMGWSASSDKFDPEDAVRVWNSFAPTQTGYRAVFAEARGHGWSASQSNAVTFAKFADDAAAADLTNISAAPFSLPELFDIPPRPWVFGRWLLRGTLTTVIAPGGMGKSALMVTMTLSLATGRNLLGKTAWTGPQRVWLWNLEDDRDELTRQLGASSLHHGICERDHEGRLFVNDPRTPLCTATKTREGLTIHEPIVGALVAEIRARSIDVLIVDPFVSSHRAEENDNGQMDAVAKVWARIAQETACSVVLVHHSRKLAGQQVDAEAARGASAVGNAARTVLVLNRMDKTEANRFGIGENERLAYIRVGNDKSNRAPATEADWFRLLSVRIANGGPEGGDDIGVIERWAPPDTIAMARSFDDPVRAQVQAKIAAGAYREHPSARDWAGHAIAEVIGAEISNLADKHRVRSLLSDMLSKQQLRKETRPDASRHPREFIAVGNPVGNDCDSPDW